MLVVRLGIAVTLLLSIFAAEAPADSVWTVVSSGEPDARIVRQLRELAAQSHATLHFSNRPAELVDRSSVPAHLVIELREDGNVNTFREDLLREASNSDVQPTPELANEGYILSISYDQRSVPVRIRIRTISSKGQHNALLRVPDLLAMGRASISTELVPRPQVVRGDSADRDVTVADYPSFPVRGIVEGFYGTPWSHRQRLEVLRFEGQHGMNVYFYGPKDDPYHRRLWREPYPAGEMRRLADLVRTAKRNFVDFNFAISPGLSMTYASEAEFQTLAKKLKRISRLGVSDFSLFLDDVPQDLVHPEDKARFNSLSQAHIYVINKLYDYLKSLSPQFHLTVCPTTYTNEWGDREYVKDLGAGVTQGVSIEWTGIEVIPDEITVAEANQWSGYLHRKPLVWDNILSNDGGPWILKLDAFRGRAAGLPAAIQGLVANPMGQVHAAFIPLQTVADYLWNPASYMPEKSRFHAIVSQYGKDGPQLLAPLLQFYSDRGEAKNGLRSIFDEQHSPIDVAVIQSQIANLDSVISQLKQHRQSAALAAELASIPGYLRPQLKSLLADLAFRHLPDGRIEWNREYDVLKATKLSSAPELDGEFSKWLSGPAYVLNDASQLREGTKFWEGPQQFSARVALRWDDDELYVGIDVTDSQLYQPYSGRGVKNGDTFRLILDTEMLANAKAGRPTSAYDLYLSPGNFADVKPSVYCEQDFVPQRPLHDYNHEIQTVWKKTARGFSADIVIPTRFFGGEPFRAGREIALSFGAQKTLPSRDIVDEEQNQIVFTSKKDKLFPVDPENRKTFQRLVLVDTN